jgi:methionyl-tRNA synthetase
MKMFLSDRYVHGTCPHCSYDDARGDQCDDCGKLLNAVELINPRATINEEIPEKKTSEHLFLDLPKIEENLLKFVNESSVKGFWSANSIATTNGWIKTGLKPRCITRDLEWGTPVPLEKYKNKVFYVWFDAPIGYISITANYTKDWE